MYVREADWLCTEPGDQRLDGESHHPWGATQPPPPGSGHQHLRLQPFPWSRVQSTLPWRGEQRHLHDASGAPAAGRGPQNRGERKRTGSQRGAQAGGGEGVSSAGGLRTERRLCCGRGHGPL